MPNRFSREIKSYLKLSLLSIFLFAVFQFNNVASAQDNDNGLKSSVATVAEEIVRTTVSGCYHNGGSKFTVSVLIDWDTPGDLTVSLDGGAQTRTIVETYTLVDRAKSHTHVTNTLQEIAFELDADGSTGHTIDVYYDSDPTTIIASTLFDAPASCEPVSCNPSSDVGGVVFNDYDLNGIQSAGETIGVQNITVTAFETDGTISTTQTDYTGGYAFSGLTYPVRVEFSNIPTSYNSSATVSGTDNGTTVQFVTGEDCSVDLGVIDPADSCQSNPIVMTSCYVNGDGLVNDPLVDDADEAFGLDTLVAFPYDLAGAQDMSQMTKLAVAGDNGTVYGLAYDKYNQDLYTSAVLRRHAGLGPLGLGGIYITDMSNHILNDATTVTTTNLIDVTTLGIDVGTIVSNMDRGLSSEATSSSTDAQAFPAVGTIGIGDIDIDDINQLLYFTNLNSKTLVVMDTAGTTATEYAVPDPGCVGGELRPWAVKYHKDNVYIGVVCNALTSQDVEDLKAAIFVFDTATNTFDPTPVFDFPLTYPKGWAARGRMAFNGWFPWTNDWNTFVQPDDSFVGVYPTPILADIEFDIDGSMILSIMDRTSYQLGNRNADLVDPPEDDFTNVAGGDVLRAYFSNGSYILENNGTAGPASGFGLSNNQGPGLGEFYNDDFDRGVFTLHAENTVGGLALLPGSGQVAVATMDPVNEIINSGGVRYLDNTTGITDHAYNVYTHDVAADAGPTFNKSAGIGDLELLCELPTTLEIGNRIWLDIDKDGVQDPNEAVLSDVSVHLYDSVGNLIATTTTDGNGNYYFDTTDGVEPNTDYYIVIDDGEFNGGELSGLEKTADFSDDALRDSNGVILDGTAPAALQGLVGAVVTTGNYNANDHTIDFGFVIGRMELGDLPDPDTASNSQDNFSTLIDGNGATHVLWPDADGDNIPSALGSVEAFWLGNIVDDEVEGQQGTNTDGDDADGIDDEDSLVLPEAWAPGTVENIPITVAATAAGVKVNVGLWMDYNNDGDFTDANEFGVASATTQTENGSIFQDTVMIPMTLPSTYSPNVDKVYVRVRAFDGGNGSAPLSVDAVLAGYTPTVADSAGLFFNGEVEDYYAIFPSAPTAVSLQDSGVGNENLPTFLLLLASGLALTFVAGAGLFLRARKR